MKKQSIPLVLILGCIHFVPCLTLSAGHLENAIESIKIVTGLDSNFHMDVNNDNLVKT